MGSSGRYLLAISVIALLAVSAMASFYSAFFGILVTGRSVDIPDSGGQPVLYEKSGIMYGYADGDYFEGSPDAPVTMIEYGDFQCPYCGSFFRDTLPPIVGNYIRTGKVKLVYRDFPLAVHANAQSAAEAAECAGEMGNYWEMHDKLFENQASLSRANYIRWAGEIGIDAIGFTECIDSGRYRLEVQQDLAEGESSGFSVTPSFLINGRPIVGAQPYSTFQQAIDQALQASL